MNCKKKDYELVHKYLSKTRKSLTRHLFHRKIDTTSNIVRISIRHKRRIKTNNNETKQIEFQFKNKKQKNQYHETLREIQVPFLSLL